MMHHHFLAASFSLFVFSEASAQVYVFAREDKADIVQSFNIEDGRSKVVKQVSQMEGRWTSLVETDSLGYGAIFCVASAGGANPRYFLSLGKPQPAEAIAEARAKAQEYAKGKPLLKVSIMRTFNNQNKYPLTRPGR